MDIKRNLYASLLLQYFDPGELADLTPGEIQLLAALHCEEMPEVASEHGAALPQLTHAERQLLAALKTAYLVATQSKETA